MYVCVYVCVYVPVVGVYVTASPLLKGSSHRALWITLRTMWITITVMWKTYIVMWITLSVMWITFSAKVGYSMSRVVDET